MEIFELVDELRNKVIDSSVTKDIPISKNTDLTSDELYDRIFDIDIFVSRKPGMRRSIQYIASDNEDPQLAKLSFMTAICSLFDTMLCNGKIQFTESEIVEMFEYWKEIHNIK